MVPKDLAVWMVMVNDVDDVMIAPYYSVNLINCHFVYDGGSILINSITLSPTCVTYTSSSPSQSRREQRGRTLHQTRLSTRSGY